MGKILYDVPPELLLGFSSSWTPVSCPCATTPVKVFNHNLPTWSESHETAKPYNQHCTCTAWANAHNNILTRIFQMLWPNLIIFGTHKRQIITNSALEKLNNNDHYEATTEMNSNNTRLRSNVRGNFVVSRTRLRVTSKAFSIAGPRAWNALPFDIKLISTRTSFCKRLKTHFLLASSLNFY